MGFVSLTVNDKVPGMQKQYYDLEAHATTANMDYVPPSIMHNRALLKTWKKSLNTKKQEWLNAQKEHQKEISEN